MSYYTDLDDDLGSAEEAERDCREWEAENRREKSSFKEAVKAEVKMQLKNARPKYFKESIKTRPPSRGETQTMKCHCGALYEARTADIKRGWAFSCSKSCAAVRRIHRKHKATKAVLK
jgi:hypothetical protein